MKTHGSPLLENIELQVSGVWGQTIPFMKSALKRMMLYVFSVLLISSYFEMKALRSNLNVMNTPIYGTCNILYAFTF